MNNETKREMLECLDAAMLAQGVLFLEEAYGLTAHEAMNVYHEWREGKE